jgi:tetratricopeptide (TPR) repeat protein
MISRSNARSKDSDIFIFLISSDSVAEGRYTLTELTFARHKWPDPNGRVLPVMGRNTPFEQIPSYLKAVTVLEPVGNITAETSAAVEGLVLFASKHPGDTINTNTSRHVRPAVEIRQDNLTPEQLKQLVDSVRGDRVMPTELLVRYEQLSQRFGVTDSALKNFLRILGEQNISDESLDNKLRQIAAKYLSLEQQVQKLSDNDPIAAPTKRQAGADIKAGDYNRAETLLVASRHQIGALELIQKGFSEQALVVLREAEQRLNSLSLGSSPDIRLLRGYLFKNIAQALSQTGEKTQADRYLDLALSEFEPIKEDVKLKAEHPKEFASAINGIGNVLAQRGRYREAIANYRLATSLVPDYAYAWHDMFIAYFKLAKQGDVDVKAMREALNKTKQTAVGLPLLDANYILDLERMLADFERSNAGPLNQRD